MKVRALELGYYGHKRRRQGEIFALQPMKRLDKKTGKVEVISPEQQLGSWMEKVDSKEVVRPGKKSPRHPAFPPEQAEVAKAAHEPREYEEEESSNQEVI